MSDLIQLKKKKKRVEGEALLDERDRCQTFSKAAEMHRKIGSNAHFIQSLIYCHLFTFLQQLKMHLSRKNV